jgi:hypothetical protein
MGDGTSVISLIISISSAIAAIASVVVAIVVGGMQTKQAERSQQITLFDKRYEIYQEALRILSFAKFALVDDENATMPNYLVIANMVLTDYNLIKDGKFLVDHLFLQRTIKTASKEESDKADRDLFYHDWDANNKLLQLREKIANTIKPSKFCFDEKIYNTLNACINELFDYILVFKNGNSQENERDKSLLVKYVLMIETDKTIEKMEEYLAITK